MPILFVDEEDAVDFERREARGMAESEVDHMRKGLNSTPFISTFSQNWSSIGHRWSGS